MPQGHRNRYGYYGHGRTTFQLYACIINVAIDLIPLNPNIALLSQAFAARTKRSFAVVLRAHRYRFAQDRSRIIPRVGGCGSAWCA